MYYRDANGTIYDYLKFSLNLLGAILVYDVTFKDSFD